MAEQAQVRGAAGSRSWWGGLAGVLGVLVPAVGLLVLPIWSFPDTSASGADLVRFVQEHRRALQIVMVLNAAGVTGWLVQAMAVGASLRRRAPVTSGAPTAFVAGSAVYVGLLLAGFTAFDVLVYRLTEPSSAALLYDLTFGLLAMSGLPTAVALTAFAVAVLRYGGLPRWTAHLAAVTAVAHALLPFTLVVGGGWAGLEGPAITVIPALLWAWVFATGLVLLRPLRPATV